MANGNVYAGFGSFCDLNPNSSRGWVLGWNSTTLAPLSAAHLDDQLLTSTQNYFLSSVWMSGYALAADAAGYLYFATGNSDPSGNSYNTQYNLSESIVKMYPDLTKPADFFSPSDASNNVQYLDQNDLDTGSGGVMLLPDQGGNTPSLAVQAGKTGQMYLLNRDNLGGHDPSGTNHVFGTYPIGPCWCGPSYFQGADTVGRVVSSGGNSIIVWGVQKSTTNPTLFMENQSPQVQTSSSQDGGFFTTVSSNATKNTIIWAVGRPDSYNAPNLTLYAFDSNATQLYSAPAGTWRNTTGNANIVPVVANGHVYVASYRTLAIFGIGPAVPLAIPPTPQAAITQHEIYGTITTLNAPSLIVETRTGALVTVDATSAIAADQSVELDLDENVRVVGDYNQSGVLLATSIIRAKNNSKLWPPDH